MSTSPLTAPDDTEPVSDPNAPTGGGPAGSAGVWILRVASALVLPILVIGFFLVFGFLKNEDANKALQVIVAIIAGTGGVWGLYWSMDRVVSMLPAGLARAVRPFAFVGPAMSILAFYLVYPAVNTLIISFQDKNSEAFVGFDNYATIFTDSFYLAAIRNSFIWVLLVPAAAVGIGLGFATMADKLSRRLESFVKSLIFLPMAISFVGAAVVWTFVYGFRPTGFGNQIGLLNGIWTAVGSEPVNWLQTAPWNNLFLMIVLVWLQTGFSMVILSSAIKGVPDALLEAARIDGASEWQAFWKVTIPSISSTIVVVWTTVLITVWKVFDIVFVMTGGLFDTQVIAQQMVDEFFTFFNFGIGAALAVLLFIAVIPVLVINVQRFRAQEATR